MATYLHFAPAIALAVALGPRRVGWRLMLAGAACGVAPDLDFLSVRMGFDRFAGTYGHRGFTHSLGFALMVGWLVALWSPAGAPGWRRRAGRGVFLAVCTLSHSLLDSLIDVHICSAWYWPLDGQRHCFGWRPIPMRSVAVFGLHRLLAELQWIGVPLLLMANMGMLVRHAWHQLRALRACVHAPEEPMKPVNVADELGPRARRRLRVAYMNDLASRCLDTQRFRRQGLTPAAARPCT